jgi:hypothetical protein
MRAACEVASISSTRPRCIRSIVTTCRSVRGGSTPPTTLEPPPQGIATALTESHQSRTAMISRSSRGKATTSGGLAKSRAKILALSKKDRP